MNSRDWILSRVDGALADLGERTPYPDWEDELAVCRNHPEFPTLWELFCYKLKQVNGTPLDGLSSLGEFLVGEGLKTGYCDPELIEAVSASGTFRDLNLSTEYDRDNFENYEFGITRATGAIAETGTLILNDRDTSARLGALTPWVHAAVFPPDRIWADFPTALRESLDDDPSLIFATGPSKTADVEGILIEGVHGPGVQIACLAH